MAANANGKWRGAASLRRGRTVARGFALIELLVVIAIIAISAAYSIICFTRKK
jgi:prepilin-type N-terminal cleavage/methylation domain-containing protein